MRITEYGEVRGRTPPALPYRAQFQATGLMVMIPVILTGFRGRALFGERLEAFTNPKRP